ncbi:uncharacterized protein (DUF1800 family) [Streptacidiphilus sp. MAP12-16]|jgi:uncharacterized protein (DUF1800 family)|uniref:DUF1800 domain-containing protein n=1 Tax=Streptacidiphilus sp. MAP12-16 TaxID=3156300 RepID=UPI0035123C80
MTTDPRSDVAHLLRRACFGGLPEEIDAAAGDGYEATVQRLVERARDGSGERAHCLVKLEAELPMDSARTPEDRALVERQRGEQARQLAARWIDEMAWTQAPLLEKRTFFWHGHFATSVQKVTSAHLMLRQYETLRALGGGDFRSLVTELVRDPAMLLWLDADDNRRSSPNENLARELMELFTLGVGHYTDTDVREAARALTAVRYDARTGLTTLDAARHDRGPMTVLGVSSGFDDAALVALLVDRPQSPRFLVSRLWRRYVAPDEPSETATQRLLHAYGPRRDLTALLTALFLEPDFRSPAARRSLVKQPVEYVVGTLRSLGIRADHGPGQDRALLLSTLTALGQAPFSPPNVGGWPAGRAWLTASSAKVRLDFAHWAVRRGDIAAVRTASARSRATAAARLLGLDGWSRRTRAALDQVRRDPEALLVLALTSPEYLAN